MVALVLAVGRQDDSFQGPLHGFHHCHSKTHLYDLRGLLMVALRSQGNWRWEGPLGTPLGLVHWKRASSPVEAGTAGYL